MSDDINSDQAIDASADAILLEHHGQISVITFNRPDKLNALGPQAIVDLMEILAQADREPSTNAIVLTGAGRGFCAGGDIESFGTAPDHRVRRRGWHLVRSMLQTEKPLVAAVNGSAIGLGLVIALLCDVVIVVDDAKIGDPHVRMGLVAGDGLAVILPMLVGPHRAKELLLTSRYITGAAAYEMGMVNQLSTREQILDDAMAIATDLAGQPAYAVRATKAVVNRTIESVAHEVLDLSLAYEEISRSLPEYPEALARWRAGSARASTSS